MLPPPRSDHRWQNGAAHQKCTADIDREHAVPIGQTQVKHSAVWIVTSGAVDQNMDGRKLIQNCLCGAFDISLVPDVAMYG
jgi:hypothetical protein